MKHLFDVEIAQKYGINAAILLENLGYWIKRNEANGTNFFDGEFWTYNSRRAYRELFPYMSQRQINTAFEKLIADGFVITGNYNKSTYDRTLWYALTKKGKCILRFDIMDNYEMENASSQNEKPIPNKYPFENDIINIQPPIPPNGREAAKNEVHALFEQFWEQYPRKVDKKGTERVFARIKGIDEIMPTILSALEKQKRSEQWKKDGGQYIPHPKTWLNQERWNDQTDAPRVGSFGYSFDPEEAFQNALARSRKAAEKYLENQNKKGE